MKTGIGIDGKATGNSVVGDSMGRHIKGGAILALKSLVWNNIPYPFATIYSVGCSEELFNPEQLGPKTYPGGYRIRMIEILEWHILTFCESSAFHSEVESCSLCSLLASTRPARKSILELHPQIHQRSR